jgi:hypothetical protein
VKPALSPPGLPYVVFRPCWKHCVLSIANFCRLLTALVLGLRQSSSSQVGIPSVQFGRPNLRRCADRVYLNI